MENRKARKIGTHMRFSANIKFDLLESRYAPSSHHSDISRQTTEKNWERMRFGPVLDTVLDTHLRIDLVRQGPPRVKAYVVDRKAAVSNKVMTCFDVL